MYQIKITVKYAIKLRNKSQYKHYSFMYIFSIRCYRQIKHIIGQVLNNNTSNSLSIGVSLRLPICLTVHRALLSTCNSICLCITLYPKTIRLSGGPACLYNKGNHTRSGHPADLHVRTKKAFKLDPVIRPTRISV